jgi:pentatricopeptide repeat protein
VQGTLLICNPILLYWMHWQRRARIHIFHSVSYNFDLGEYQILMDYFAQMNKEGIKPDKKTFHIILLALGRQVSRSISHSIWKLIFISKGNIDLLQQYYNEMKTMGVKPDILCYNTVLKAYGMKGDLRKMFQVCNLNIC